MLREEIEEKSEDLFDEWQLELQADQTMAVKYDHYDQSLDTVFLRRTDAFPAGKAKDFQNLLNKEVDTSLRVSTIKVPHFV